MSKITKISIKLMILFSILFLNSCNVKQAFPGLWPSPTPTLSPELMDRSWLTDQPCRAPCWYDLTLGSTSKSVAQEKVLQLPFISSQKVTEKPLGISTYYCKQPIQHICTILYFYEDRLDAIGLAPNFNINLQEVVDTINPPDFLSFRSITPDKMFGRDCQIELFWVDRQMVIRYFNYRDNDMCKI
ncbi:MAG: hypothetical protein JW908_07655 [Anaerolineales bacterium]|nr:hypothetical protein [Anaerolineales bacterium]